MFGSDDKHYHSDTGTPYKVDLASGGDVVFWCNCDYCGAPFDSSIPYDEAIQLLEESYDTYVTDNVEPNLGTTIVSSSGYILPIPVKGFLILNGSGFKLDDLISVESSSYGGLDNSIVFLSGTLIIGLWLDTDYLPCSLLPFSGIEPAPK